jgi:hypothetical protein
MSTPCSPDEADIHPLACGLRAFIDESPVELHVVVLSQLVGRSQRDDERDRTRRTAGSSRRRRDAAAERGLGVGAR